MTFSFARRATGVDSNSRIPAPIQFSFAPQGHGGDSKLQEIPMLKLRKTKLYGTGKSVIRDTRSDLASDACSRAR